MKKDLEYYLSLDYPVEIRRIPEDEGGGFMASIPFLGSYAFVGDGETPEEAYENLQVAKREIFKDYLRDGLEIPEPPEDDEPGDYSGRFLARIPAELHRDLAEAAKANGSSLNQYVVYALTRFRYSGAGRSAKRQRKRKAAA